MSLETSIAQDTSDELTPSLAWGIVLALAIVVAAPLTYPGFLRTHEGFLPVFRAYELLASGQWLGWMPSLGTSGTAWQLDGRLPYWLAALGIRLGMTGTAAIRLTSAIALFLGVGGMFTWARSRLSLAGAVVAAVAYGFTPWLVAMLYVRGALGELWIWALVPWLLSSLDGEQRSLRRVATAGVIWVLLLWSQAGLGVLAIVSSVLAAVISRRVAPLALAASGVGLAVGVVGLLPWFARDGAGTQAFYDHFLYLFQLIMPTWGYGVSQPGWQDEISFQVGAVPLALALLSLVPASMVPSDGARRSRDRGIAATIVIALALLSLGVTAPLWRLVHGHEWLRFPWQVLTVAVPWLAWLAGSAIDRWPTLRARSYWAIVVALLVVTSYPYLTPRFTQVEPREAPLGIFGDIQIALIDAGVSGDIRPGGTITVTLTWQALRPIDLDYTVFLHVADEADQIVAQRDMQPGDGQSPTNTWAVGDVIEDVHPIPIPPEASAVPHHLNMGLYDWRTGQRLPVGDTNFIRLNLPPRADSSS
ncbi:MAG: hypothetical protein Kow0047_19860 [Anaerolineae bacterium]